MDKNELLEQMDAEHAAILALVENSAEDLVTRKKIYGKLSVKDVVAHLTAWQQLEIVWIMAARRQKLPLQFLSEYPRQQTEQEDTLDRLNEHIYQQNKDLSLEIVLAAFRTVHQEITDLVRGLTEEEMGKPERSDWWEGQNIWDAIAENTCDHLREHRITIENWLAAQA